MLHTPSRRLYTPLHHEGFEDDDYDSNSATEWTLGISGRVVSRSNNDSLRAFRNSLFVMALACLHHLYGTPSAFPQAMQGVDTFNKFRTYMAQYIGPTSPK